MNHPRSLLYPPTTIQPLDTKRNIDAIAVFSFTCDLSSRDKGKLGFGQYRYRVTVLTVSNIDADLRAWRLFRRHLLLCDVLHLVDCLTRNLLGLVHKPLTRFADVLGLESGGRDYKSHRRAGRNRNSSDCERILAKHSSETMAER